MTDGPRVGAWLVAVAACSFPAAVIGAATSPGFWWSEGPFQGAACFLLTDRTDGAFLFALLAWPIAVFAALFGVQVGLRRPPWAGQAPAFRWQHRVALAVTTVAATGAMARLLFDAALRLGRLPGHDACYASVLAPSIAWTTPCLIIAGLFALGTRCADFY